MRLSEWLRGLDLNQRPSGYEPEFCPCKSTTYKSVESLLNPFFRPASLKINWLKTKGFRKFSLNIIYMKS